MNKTYRILNLGAGVQSTAVYLLIMEGKIDPIDCAIFADTQDEPKAVYDHLDWLMSLGGPEIKVRTVGCLGDNLINGMHSDGGRSVSIPAFVDGKSACEKGIVRRQCTSEYKVKVVEKCIREEVLGLNKGEISPRSVVTQLFGISVDEGRRAVNIRERISKVRWSAKTSFPLIDDFWWRRGDCIKYLSRKVKHNVPRSACVFCPYRSNDSWKELKKTDKDGWNRAVEIDEALRDDNSVIRKKGLRGRLYLHKSCIPLKLVDLEDKRRDIGGFLQLGCDEGMCGV
jgi:hypothetical protein